MTLQHYGQDFFATKSVHFIYAVLNIVSFTFSPDEDPMSITRHGESRFIIEKTYPHSCCAQELMSSTPRQTGCPVGSIEWMLSVKDEILKSYVRLLGVLQIRTLCLWPIM